jgi:hypothetical protein
MTLRSLRSRSAASLLLAWCTLATASACGDDDDATGPGAGTAGSGGRPPGTGSACDSPDDCYQGLEAGKPTGEVQCLDRVEGGYCTHLCTRDEDCCAVPGECQGELRQVCAPFESLGAMLCFLSCEEADLKPLPGFDAGSDVDPEAWCKHAASTEFICRSTGGGSDNEKVCVPQGSGTAGAGGADAAGG